MRNPALVCLTAAEPGAGPKQSVHSTLSQLCQASDCVALPAGNLLLPYRFTMNIFRWGKTAGGSGGGAAPPPPGNPLELITYDTDTGQFHLGSEALKVLRGVKGPVGVVAVSGRARQGKSFILNQLLGQSSGFTVASTHRPCTKGLWMWSTPVERQSSDGSKYHLVRDDSIP